MSIQYDLHTHSTASDGTLRPAELVQAAAAAGIDVMALTDHDTLAGLDEAAQMAGALGLRLISGVEISVTWQGAAVHILGLNVNPECELLQQGLVGLREYRHWRAEEIGRRLDKKGIGGAFEAASALSTGKLVSRTHFARFLVAEGYARDVREVFRKYLVQGKPGHVPGKWAALENAIDWILQAQGTAVIAHPARYNMTRSKLRKLIAAFKEAGGQGLEVVSGSHSKDEYLTMARHAKDFGLLSSAGSDFHDPKTPWIALGRLPPLPVGCDPVWRNFS
jgi:predicted metal-dependent phosphoesterase TrpH